MRLRVTSRSQIIFRNVVKLRAALISSTNERIITYRRYLMLQQEAYIENLSIITKRIATNCSQEAHKGIQN